MNKKDTLKIIVFFLFLSFINIRTAEAQRFDGGLVLGLNAAQIDGDNLWGYNKLGLTGGLKLSYGLEKPWFLSMELLYSQRGSQSELVKDASIPIRKINLQYIELPLIVSYKDWWIEGENYYKVNAEAGLSYGYLFDASVSEGSFTVGNDQFKEHDISFLVGANYFISPRWGFGIRYTRSINFLYENSSTGDLSYLGYFLSFRGLYQF